MKSSIVLLFLFSLYGFSNEEQDFKFQQANQLYQQSAYDQAIEVYLDLLKLRPTDSTLFYNLGNSYFKKNENGKAIYYFRKALELKPRDGDIKYNLDLARGKTVDKIERPLTFQSRLFFLSESFSYSECLILVTIAGFLVFVSFIIAIFFQSEVIRSLKIVCVCLLVFALFIAAGHIGVSSRIGVITAGEANVFSSIGKDNVVLFTVHEGAEFKIGQTHDDQWIQVIVSDDQKGWTQASNAIFDRQ